MSEEMLFKKRRDSLILRFDRLLLITSVGGLKDSFNQIIIHCGENHYTNMHFMSLVFY